jgi:hypothetical protein
MVLITQREAAERITDAWGIPMHESKLSVLISAGIGPQAHGRQGTATMYTLESVDAWAASEVRKKIAELEGQIATLTLTLQSHSL